MLSNRRGDIVRNDSAVIAVAMEEQNTDTIVDSNIREHAVRGTDGF